MASVGRFATESVTGQAAILLVMLISALFLVVAFGISAIAFNNLKILRNVEQSLQSYYVAEAGIEDTLLRIIDADLNYEEANIVTLGGHTATTNVAPSGSELIVTSQGDATNRIRTVSTTLRENTVGASFFYGIQVDDGGLEMGNNARVSGNVYSNGNITGSNGATISGDAVVAGGLDTDPQVEWTTQNADQFFATASTNRDIAQSFTATETGTLPQIALYLGKSGNPTNNITVRLTTDNGGKPATSSLASDTIAFTQVSTTPNWVTVSFSAPPTVTNNTKYWIVLDTNSNSATHYWNWRKDSPGAYANNSGSFTSNWGSGGAAWTSVNGDLAFRVWIGGNATGISGMTVGDATSGTGRANLFTNTTIHGSACPNQYCLVENPVRQNLPIPDVTVQDWKAGAEEAGVHNGTYTLTNGASATIGPLKITGDLVVDNNAVLTLAGTIWVQGDVRLSNGCVIQLDSGYGANSGVLLTDGVVQVSNNCSFAGSGDPASYILLLSDKDDLNSTVMDIDNNALGVIYYAARGQIHFSNNAVAKEATAYGIELDNNATITYESGLQNISFTAGPAGGWDILRWQEVE